MGAKESSDRVGKPILGSKNAGEDGPASDSHTRSGPPAAQPAVRTLPDQPTAGTVGVPAAGPHRPPPLKHAGQPPPQEAADSAAPAAKDVSEKKGKGPAIVNGAPGSSAVPGKAHRHRDGRPRAATPMWSSASITQFLEDMLHGVPGGGAPASLVDRVLARMPEFQSILSCPPSQGGGGSGLSLAGRGGPNSGLASSWGRGSGGASSSSARSATLNPSQVDLVLRILTHADVEAEPDARARNTLLLEAARSDAFMRTTLPWTLRERGGTPSQALQVTRFCALVLAHLPQCWREVPIGDIRDAAERMARRARGGGDASLATLQSRVAELRDLVEESERVSEGAAAGLGLNVPLGGPSQTGVSSGVRGTWVAPPQSHRELSIIPTAHDMVRRDPYLRANVVGGVPWQGAEHYLDTTFRLMRENFLQPLREAIEAWVPPGGRGDRRQDHGGRRKDPSSRGGEKRVRQDSVHVYHDVKVARVATGKGGELVLFLGFRTATPIDFGRSQALQHGNAVFLVQVGARGGGAMPHKGMAAVEGEEGEDARGGGLAGLGALSLQRLMERDPRVLVATVSDREQLEEGRAGPPRGGNPGGHRGGLAKGGSRVFAGVSKGVVFWPSVEPVLRRLRALTADDLPFPEALVSLQGGAHPPLYIRSNPNLPVGRYPFAAALAGPAQVGHGAHFGRQVRDPPFRGRIRDLPLGPREGEPLVPGAGVFRAYPQPTLDVINGWPADYMSAQVQAWQPVPDEYQFEALRHIMTHQVSLVQGPPGTGKTFTTVIAIMLMVAAAARHDRPLLVITYTNHALDQILAKLAAQMGHDRIVRMGGALRDESLRLCTVQEACKRERSFVARREHAILRERMDRAAASLHHASARFFACVDALDACEDLRHVTDASQEEEEEENTGGAARPPRLDRQRQHQQRQRRAPEAASKTQRAAQQLARCLGPNRGPLEALGGHFRRLLGRYDLRSDEEGLRVFLEGDEEAMYGARLDEEREAKRREIEARRRQVVEMQNMFQLLASVDGEEGEGGEDGEGGGGAGAHEPQQQEDGQADGGSVRDASGHERAGGRADSGDALGVMGTTFHGHTSGDPVGEPSDGTHGRAVGNSAGRATEIRAGRGDGGGGNDGDDGSDDGGGGEESGGGQQRGEGEWETVTGGRHQRMEARARRAAERAARAAEVQGRLAEHQAALGTLEEEMDYLDSSILFMRERRGGGDPDDDDEYGDEGGLVGAIDGNVELAGDSNAGVDTRMAAGLPEEWVPYLQAARAAEVRMATVGGGVAPGQPSGPSNGSACMRAMPVQSMAQSWLADEAGSSRGGAAAAGAVDMASLRRRCFPWNIPHAARLGLLTASLAAAKGSLEARLAPLMAQQEQLKVAMSAVRRAENLETMRRAAVVGMTSTKAAGETELLMQLRPAAVVVEECGELLEGQLLACLPRDLEHLPRPFNLQRVLVGDHEQLRPKVECYELERRHNIHVSMFERLITPRVGHVAASAAAAATTTVAAPAPAIPTLAVTDAATGAATAAATAAGSSGPINYPPGRDAEATRVVPSPPLAHVRLKVQMRMRPEVSRLVRIFYPDIRDHPSVLQERPHVAGVCRSVAMINHTEPEAGDQRSKTNAFEAAYVAALTAYLIAVRQFAPRQITIIAAYLGQRFLIVRHLMELGVRVSQAEPDNPRIVTIDDYQGEENEVIILSLVRSNDHEPMPSFGFMKVRNRIIVALSRARCGLFILGNGTMFARNEHWSRVIAELRDMDAFFPPGMGLELSCPRHPDRRKAACTPQDFKAVSHGGCAQNCGQQLACGHTCPLLCHPQQVHDEVQCQKPCALDHPGCGHRCEARCWRRPCPPCRVPVTRTLLGCGHAAQMLCSDDVALIRCMQQITVTLPCGHTRNRVRCHERATAACREPCLAVVNPGACNQPCTLKCSHPGAHECKQLCERPLMCAHACTKACRNCSPHECECAEPCEYTCRHAVCREGCSAPCVRCVEPCGWACPHKGACTRLCHEVCDRDGCDQPCPKQASCKKKGHRCAGLCGELCPPCVTCALPADWSDPVALVSKEDLDVRQQKLYKLECGHIFLVETMDGYMATERNEVALKGCPVCRRVIYDAPRYGNFIKRNRLAVEEVKLIIRRERAERARRIAQLEEAADRSAALQLPGVTRWYRCTNCGCPFAVGDCGQLNEGGTCSSCQARIGGGAPSAPLDPQEVRALGQGVAEYDRQLAINAMRADPGLMGTAGRHWYRCPRGHPFFIGDCGGAMEHAICPECGAQIGG
eukprot:jgi/Mesvir1/29232/Mv11413-RA.1